MSYHYQFFNFSNLIQLKAILNIFRDIFLNKPKIFIIQTLDQGSLEKAKDHVNILPIGSDYFVWNASLNRLLPDGFSPFIRVLTAVIANCAYEYDLLMIYRKVNQLISQLDVYKECFNSLTSMNVSLKKSFLFKTQNIYE